ncbi:MAG: hypothetical protein LUE92_14500 [Clostridiales bacterium]|nr:hypothetical protein [Clostridiales bacterium]
MTTNYTVRIGLQAPVRCALVSDLHDRDPSMVLEVLREETPDLILAAGDLMAGHTHGGQWRVFSAGGKKRGIPVFAPGQGLFPKYAYGRYGKMVVSSGVSNTTEILRFGNPCEVVMLELD